MRTLSLGIGIALACAWAAPLACSQGTALSLDGDGDYVDVPSTPAVVVSGDMTVEAWIRIDAYPTHPAEIVNKKRRDPWAGFTLHLQNGLLQLAIARSTAGPTFHNASASWLSVVPGQWTHVAGVVRGTQIELHVNGSLEAATQAPGGVVGSNTNPLRIGYDSEAPTHNPATEFTGLIDEVRFWSVGRTGAEVQATMFSEVDGLPGLVGAWHLNGNALDSTGGHHGTLHGNATFANPPSWMTCAAGPTCLNGNVPVPIGTPLTLTVGSPATNAPIFVLADTTTGSVPLGPWGTSQIGFSPATFALADPTGIVGPGLGPSTTGVLGSWTLTLPTPSDPSLAAVSLYVEAFVLDFAAANGLFHQSNLLAVTFL